MKFDLRHMKFENFKGFKNFEADFYDFTKISGANGLGKSTIAEGYMWLFWGIGYNLRSNPNVRRKVDRAPVLDVPVSVEATVIIDGKEVTAKKVQKRSVKKDGSFSDDNTYFINDVPKTLRDFNEYFGIDMDAFKLCSNVNAFLEQKSKEMRDFLFGLVDEVSDLDVARQVEALAELVPLLEKYSVSELDAMTKASMKKINDELKGIPAAITENERRLSENIDTAELELQKNAIEEQISEIRSKMHDSDKARAEWQKKSDDIISLQFEKSSMERVAMDKLRSEKRAIQSEIDTAETEFSEAMRAHSNAEYYIAILEEENQKKSDQKDKLLKEWHAENKKAFPRENDEFVELSEDDLLCPTCGQPLPENLKSEKIAETDTEREKFYAKKEADREKFLQNKQAEKSRINADGRRLMKEIEENSGMIEKLRNQIEEAKAKKVECNNLKSQLLERLTALPDRPDMSENQDYVAICAEIQKKEEALKAEDSGASYRQSLQRQLDEKQAELDGVKEKLYVAAENAKCEDRIEELNNLRRKLDQDKADCEKVLNLLEQLDEQKNTLLVDKINSFFRYVKWDLFSRAKNGSYKKDYCKPVINGKDYGDDTNTGLEILARLDIAMAVQQATGIYCPIFLDYGESIDSWRIPKGESQLIVLCRTDDRELKIEEVA